ncbi:MAG: hypothetical protein EBZ48_04715 [Proteobacteria bacterium]|nr:hypothetical protein [Pseudomonadota bacterium]
MTLAHTLSALREMILDVREYPDSIVERKEFLKSRYPGLSELESEDLARIPPERLALYTESIFASERGLLRAKFPISFALIKRAASACGESIDFYDLARSLHDWRPWRSSRVPDLARNFADFIASQHAKWLESEPLLEDALQLELCGMEVARAPNDTLVAKNSARLSGSLELSLDALISMQGFIPAFVAHRSFSCDVTMLFDTFRELRELPVSIESSGVTVFAICSRDADYVVHWSRVSPELSQAFGVIPRSVCFPLHELAEGYVQRLSSDYDEAAAAQALLCGLIELNTKGALLLPPAE